MTFIKKAALFVLLFASVVLLADVVAKVCTRVPQPVDSPGAGTYGGTQTVTYTDSYSGAFICYTTNGSDPTFASGACTNGTQYTTGISVAATTTLKAIACGTNYSCSTLGTSVYTISGAVPTFNNATSDTDGGSTSFTTSFTPTNGRNFILGVASAANADFSCSDAEGTGNTYTADANSINTGATPDIRIKIFHVFNISGSGTYVITCAAATTPAFHLIEVSNITALAGTSAGTNPSADISNGNTGVSPAAFTPTDANVILYSMVADTTGSTITFTLVDGSFTKRGTECVNGASCFVSSMATRVVSSSASYSDGWTLSAATDRSGVLIAYK